MSNCRTALAVFTHFDLFLLGCSIYDVLKPISIEIYLEIEEAIITANIKDLDKNL